MSGSLRPDRIGTFAVASPSAVIHPSHRGLLRLVTGKSRGVARLDAVIVPSSRGPGHLAQGEALAHALGCPLLVLAGGTTAPPARTERGPAASAVVVGIPAGLSLPLLDFATARHAEATSRRNLDVSTKRNLGLIVARLTGWQRILFLDDDVRDVGPLAVARTLGALGRLRAAGWTSRHFPDNSVVCHANRLSGAWQDTFVSASALAIQVEGCLPFFPPVYNEDWLFLYPWVARAAVAWAGDVRQIPYDPFLDPARAAGQEFGDVLGEGLFHLLHERQSLRVACSNAYWAAVIDARRLLLDRIEWRLERTAFRDGRVGPASPALRSLARSRCRLESIAPETLADYVEAWRGDLHAWNGRLARLPRLGSLPEALDHLGLSEHVRDTRPRRTA